MSGSYKHEPLPLIELLRVRAAARGEAFDGEDFSMRIAQALRSPQSDTTLSRKEVIHMAKKKGGGGRKC